MSDFNLQAKGLFGRYCRIEMFRNGVPNEFYVHKIVSQNRQNAYCDVPLRWNCKPEKHEAKEGMPFPDNLEEVIWVVQCGIDETKVFPVALKDVELLGEDFNEGCEFQEADGDRVADLESSVEHLESENARLTERANELKGEIRAMSLRFTEIFAENNRFHLDILEETLCDRDRVCRLVKDMWRLLVLSGNDGLVVEVRHPEDSDWVVDLERDPVEVIDAATFPARMRELEIDADIEEEPGDWKVRIRREHETGIDYIGADDV